VEDKKSKEEEKLKGKNKKPSVKVAMSLATYDFEWTL
jgi:hypothetical protein